MYDKNGSLPKLLLNFTKTTDYLNGTWYDAYSESFPMPMIDLDVLDKLDENIVIYH